MTPGQITTIVIFSIQCVGWLLLIRSYQRCAAIIERIIRTTRRNDSGDA